ncbi:A-type potassium channel modulatory protein KCNIP1-like isoform X8 [Parasteatoda tepidariorum]|uniref:A-type potassium channel modulatory protein KCNIP1-like isoform X8 n=1 Tax=Parasteatoda tepidariorum TaxID=114398 RepID=UPI00077FB475|nr:Kv channel-interacting protein 1-like isoform X2 [Parasteatoda tepidariorum]
MYGVVSQHSGARSRVRPKTFTPQVSTEQPSYDSSKKTHRNCFRRFLSFLRDAWYGITESNDSEFDEMDGAQARFKPEAIDTLCQLTKFNKRELQLMYRGFKQECPSGMVREETFKGIYAQYFPKGADTSQYAHYVFNTFDQDHTGAITFTDFVIGLSVLARGSLQEKLRWVFSLYDINGDGYITKDEMSRIIASIYDMMGKSIDPPMEEFTTRDHVERVFQKLDLNNDGVVTMEEFMNSCTQDEHIKKSMTVFNTVL